MSALTFWLHIREDIKMRRAAITAVLLFLIQAMQPVFGQHGNASMRIEPPEVLIDLFYSGAKLRVSGMSRTTGNLALLCTGEEGTVELKEKKRVAGLLWVNGGEITFEHVPSLYQLASSGKLSDLIAESESAHSGIGFRALESQVVVPRLDEDRQRRCFSELIKLKKHEGLYSISEGGLELHPLGDDWKEFSTTINFPPDAGPGTYYFRLISFAKGKATELANKKITVRLAGTAAFIRSLSLGHGFLYGVFSVVIALAAGLLTGAIFTRRSRKLGH